MDYIPSVTVDKSVFREAISLHINSEPNSARIKNILQLYYQIIKVLAQLPKENLTFLFMENFYHCFKLNVLKSTHSIFYQETEHSTKLL